MQSSMAVIEDQASSDETVASRDVGRGGAGHVVGPKTQRAKGRAHLHVVPRTEDEPRTGSKLADLRMSGSLKLLFPRHDGPLDAVFLNSAGGITGGDAFDLSAKVDKDASLRLSSQAAERIYKAMPGQVGQVNNRLEIAADASLYWLPQETILFDDAALDRRLDISMASTSRLLACEVLLFGRQAMGEIVQNLCLNDRIDLRVDGELVFADRLRIRGNAQEHLNHAAVTSGGLAVGSVIFAAQGASGMLDAVRALLPISCGASALSEDLVFLRLSAPDGFELRQILIPVLRLLSGGDLPRPWMI